MRDKRTLAKVLAGIVLVTGASLGAASPAQANDTGWNGTKTITERGGNSSSARWNSDTGWNGT